MNINIDNILTAKLRIKANKENKREEDVVKEILEEALKEVQIETIPLSKPQAIKKPF